MNYWKEYGETLRQNGFTIIPIHAHDSDLPGAGKRPIGKDWEATVNTESQVANWAKKYPNNGIGFLTKHTPAVDIDIYDKDAALHMEKWVLKKFGTAPCRIGRAPKRLFLFRTDTPFSKVKSGVWEDDFGEKHAVEILANGQQFVGFGIHPDTKKEYVWVDGDSPVDYYAELDLEEIDLDGARAVAAEFDRYAAEQGWTKVKNPINGNESAESADDDDWASTADIQKWDGSYEDLRDIVMKYPNPDDYESWITVISALQISCRDQDEAKDIARDWSMQADNYDESEFDYKWDKGFSHKSNSLVTIGSIIKVVKDLEKEELEEKLADFSDGFTLASTLAEWNDWARDFRKVAVFGLERNAIMDAAADAYRRLTGKKMYLKDRKSSLGFDLSNAKAPAWLKKYVFSGLNDSFVDRETGEYVARSAVDFMHADESIIGEERFKPCELASTVFKVPIVHDVTYNPIMHGDMPGNKWKMDDEVTGPEFFRDQQGKVWFNTFDPTSIPVSTDCLTKYDKKAVEIIKDLMIVLFPDSKERGYVMDWLAWVIQNPTKRINYSLLIRGAHGSGKSTIGILMSHMLGRSNVGYVSNTVMNGRFSDWAEGHILKIVEEIFDKGDRYSAVERQKEFITNDTFQVEPKGKKAKEVINTSSKLMFTNHFNALPLDANQRRYLVVSTQAENHLDMERVYGSGDERSSFFKDVYRAIENHAPAIKGWFESWEISKEFNHKGHAPQDTEAFNVMVDASDDGLGGMIAQFIKSGTVPGVHRDIIFMPSLKNALLAESAEELPKTNRLKNLLMELGFKPGGLLKFDGDAGRVYVRKRVKGAFKEDGSLNTNWAQSTLKRHDSSAVKPDNTDPDDDDWEV